ncbi:hypothetical protein ACFU99_35265 [Streptomyces sp. NPDC057654]|uniref:hypothetical protein n=1 Tax=Streptomyces sp. NPDC057654 TaxID=3346196 RepID=UPI0036B278A3
MSSLKSPASASSGSLAATGLQPAFARSWLTRARTWLRAAATRPEGADADAVCRGAAGACAASSVRGGAPARSVAPWLERGSVPAPFPALSPDSSSSFAGEG